MELVQNFRFHPTVNKCHLGCSPKLIWSISVVAMLIQTLVVNGYLGLIHTKRKREGKWKKVQRISDKHQRSL